MAKKGQHHAEWHPRKETCHKQWAKHGVDTDPIRYGKRKATRDVTNIWAGIMQVIKREAELRFGNDQELFFRAGRGLEQDEQRYALYVQDTLVGYHSDSQYALAWARAARAFLPPDRVVLVDRLASS